MSKIVSLEPRNWLMIIDVLPFVTEFFIAILINMQSALFKNISSTLINILSENLDFYSQ